MFGVCGLMGHQNPTHLKSSIGRSHPQYPQAEYDATEKGMDPCLCGAPEGVCLGAVRGFKVRVVLCCVHMYICIYVYIFIFFHISTLSSERIHDRSILSRIPDHHPFHQPKHPPQQYLPLPQQIARLGCAADHLFDRFIVDHTGRIVVIDRREGPEGGEDGAVFLDLGDGVRPPRLLAARAVPAGAVVYEGRSRLVRPLGCGNGDDGGAKISVYTCIYICMWDQLSPFHIMYPHTNTYTEYPRVVLVVGPHALPLDPLAVFSSAYDAEGTREVYG